MTRISGPLKEQKVPPVPENAAAPGNTPTVRRGRGKPLSFTVDQARDALVKHHGCLHFAAKDLYCCRTTIQNYCYRHPELQEVAVAARESVLDRVEHSLYQKAMGGDSACMFFLLKTQGRARGYTERADPQGSQPDYSRLTDAEMLTLGPLLRKLSAPAPPVPVALTRSPRDLPPP